MIKLIPHIFLISLILLSSCNNKKDIPSNIEKPKQELRIILADPVETLDPLKILYRSDWKVASNIFDGLVNFDKEDNIQKNLLDTLIISKNNLKYRFELKDNIYFHDNPCFENGIGRKLNSEDILYTFQRLATKSNKFANWQAINKKINGITDYYNGLNSTISGIVVIDSLKFEIHLLKPFSSFLKLLASPSFYIVPKEGVEFYREKFSDNPVGTGPFRIANYLKYEKVLLVRNENYYKRFSSNNKFPLLNFIEYKTIEESSNRFSELLKNKTDFVSVNINDFKKLKMEEQLFNNYTVKSIEKGMGARFWSFYFDDNRDDENYKLLRRQIINSFNKDFLKNVTQTNSVAHSLVPSHYLGDYKPAENLQLEFNTSLSDSITILANLKYLDLEEIEKTLITLNIPYKIVIQQKNYYASISDIKPTLFRISMVPSYPDPIEYYSLFYSGNSGTVNLGNFKNEDYDEVYEYVQTLNSREEQIEAYVKLEEILINEGTAIYLTHQGSLNYIYTDKLKNVSFNFITPDFTKAYFE